MRSKLEILVNGLAAGLEIKIPDGPTLAIRDVAPETTRASSEPRYTPTLVQKLTRTLSSSDGATTSQDVLIIQDMSVNELIQLAEHLSEADVAGIVASLGITPSRALDARREQTGLTPAIKRAAPSETLPERAQP